MSKSTKNSPLEKILIALVIVGFVSYVAVTVTTQQKQINALQGQKQEAEAELKELKKEREKIEKQIMSVDSEDYVEKYARENLNMVRPGDIVYIDENAKGEDN